MKHKTALSDKTKEKIETDCEMELEFRRDTFHSDVDWSVYYCPTCKKEVYMVGGVIHWWNYDCNPKEVCKRCHCYVLKVNDQEQCPDCFWRLSHPVQWSVYS